MGERDLTAREDKFIGLCLTAAAIIVFFVFVGSYVQAGRLNRSTNRPRRDYDRQRDDTGRTSHVCTKCGMIGARRATELAGARRSARGPDATAGAAGTDLLHANISALIR